MIIDLFLGGINHNYTYMMKRGNKTPYCISKIVFYRDGKNVFCIDFSDVRFYTMSLECKNVGNAMPIFKKMSDLFLEDETDVVLVKDNNFGWRDKKGCYILFIPCDSVGITCKGYETRHGDNINDYDAYTYTIENVMNFVSMPNNDSARQGSDGYVDFVEKRNYRLNKKYKFLADLSDSINDTCGTRITLYEMNKLLSHYKIERLSEGEPPMYETSL